MIRGLLRIADPMTDQRLVTLIYHRVRPEPDPLFSDEVDARRFAQQMRTLRDYFTPMPVHEACVRLRERRLPPRAVCITFDDGYADNRDVAWPILREHGLTAAFFIATDFLDGGRMWNDTIIEAIRRVSNSLLQTPDGDRLPTGSTAEKRSTIEALIRRCKRLEPGARADYVSRIAASSRVVLPDHLMLTSVALQEMAAAGLEIGGHTAAHPVLTAIDPSSAAREIELGAQRIMEITGRRPRLFAYPNGRPVADYAAEHVSTVRSGAFEFAFSTATGYASVDSDPFQLPRFTPWDRAPSKFAARLWAHFFVPQRERVS